jgi:N12 class adenine-specific DNA methylase
MMNRPRLRPPPPERHIGEGSFFVGDDRVIYQSQQGGQGVPVVYGGTTLKADGTLMGKRLAALIGLRDRARRVLQSQNEGWPEAHRNEARRELNRAYDRFDLAYGPINKTTFGETADGSVIRRMPNLVKFREDPDAMLVMSLEDYDEDHRQSDQSRHHAQGRGGQDAAVTHVRSPRKDCWSRLNQRGTVDLPFIATLYGKPESQRSSPNWAT